MQIARANGMTYSQFVRERIVAIGELLALHQLDDRGISLPGFVLLDRHLS